MESSQLKDKDIIYFRNGIRGVYHLGRLFTDNPELLILNFRFPKEKELITEWDVVKVIRVDFYFNRNSVEKSIEVALKNVDLDKIFYEENKTFLSVYYYLTDFPNLKITNRSWIGDKIDCDNYNNFNYYADYVEILRIISPLKTMLEFYSLKQNLRVKLTDVEKDSGKHYSSLGSDLINQTHVCTHYLGDSFLGKNIWNFISGNYFDDESQVISFIQDNPEFVNKLFKGKFSYNLI